MDNDGFSKLHNRVLIERNKESDYETWLEILRECHFRGLSLAPKGFWHKRCPVCGVRLKERIWRGWLHYICVTEGCGYEYASHNILNIGYAYRC